MFLCRCPKCRSAAKVPDKLEGKTLRCKRCDVHFIAQRPLKRIEPPAFPDLIGAAPREPKKSAEELHAESTEKMIEAAKDINRQWVSYFTLALLLPLIAVFAMLFFCCGLPLIISGLENSK